MNSINILATGIYLPEKVVTNDDYAGFIETSDDWITSRTGMKKRHIATTEPTWYIGAKAAESALAQGNIPPSSIDLIIFTTITPDFFTPSLACMVQKYLNIPKSMALDINVACTGFAFALDMAKRYLETGGIEQVLIVSGESLSQITNYEDRSTCVLFADGGGACVVSKKEGLYGSIQCSLSDGTEHIYAKIPRRPHPLSPETNTEKHQLFDESVDYGIYMNGREVYKFATKAVTTAVQDSAKAAGISVDDLDLIIPHQANLRILQTVAKNLNISMDKMFVNIEKYGNTSSASAAICLHEAITENKIKRNSKICVVGFGAGLTYGAVTFVY